MHIEKRQMTEEFQIPTHWKAWASRQGYSASQIMVLCTQFKEFYLQKGKTVSASEFGWENRFRRWVLEQRRPLPVPIQPVAIVPEPKPAPTPQITPHIGRQYLAIARMILKNAGSNKVNV